LFAYTPEKAMRDSSPVPYELFALRYAKRSGTRAEFFLGAPHDDAPMGLDYYVWLARRPGHVCLIDTGFNESAARRRGRELLRNPIDALELLGTSRTQVQDVVLTHFHYDHAGNFDRFPDARFHVQESEMQFATGRHLAHRAFMADSDDHVIPGHDPRVMQRYAAPSPGLEGIAVRLDEAPRQLPLSLSNERR